MQFGEPNKYQILERDILKYRTSGWQAKANEPQFTSPVKKCLKCIISREN